jgi:hypothetical protein
LVVTITVVTALYALGALLRQRGREIGHLRLLGLGQRQLAILLGWETFFLGIGATVVGIGIGVLTGKLWYLGFSSSLGLQEPLPFSVQSTALLQTVLLYGSLFGVAGLGSAFWMGRRPLVQLLQAESRRDGSLRVSWVQVVLCVAAFGLAGALMPSRGTSDTAPRLLGMVATLAVGTYLLYTQGSVAILGWLRGRRLYWRSTNLLLLAGLGHRLRNNARILWLVTLLASLTIWLIGNLTGNLLQMRRQTEALLPVDMVLEPSQNGASTSLTVAKVRALMATAGVRIQAEQTITVGLYEGRGAGAQVEAAIVPWSSWEAWRTVQPDLPTLDPDRVSPLVDPVFWKGPPELPLPEEVRQHLPSAIRAEPQTLRIRASLWGAWGLTGGNSPTVVVPDATWESLRPSLRLVPLTGWHLADWFGEARQITEAVRGLDPGERPQLPARGWLYWHTRTEGGVITFLFSFLGLLFFLSSGAILTFKLFMDIEGDRQRFLRLGQIGLAPAEMGRIIKNQAAILFLTPLTLAGLYGGGGVWLMGRINGTELWPGGLVALGAYAVLQLLYWSVAVRAYRWSLRPS